MQKYENWIKLAGTALCEFFTVFTIFMFWAGGELDRQALAFVTLLLVALPMLVEKLFHCRSWLSRLAIWAYLVLWRI